MIIRYEIDEELWEAVQKKYELQDYSGAIVESIFKLTETIRNKSGLTGDGKSLIIQAFGGDDPLIKLNSLHTQSEKDFQKGIQEILGGIYSAIRNPRSHDSSKDDQQTADAILIFVNYLLKVVDSSRLRFNQDEYLRRVFDPLYVNSDEYSILLTRDIPKRQKVEIAIQVIMQRGSGDIYSLYYFLHALFAQLDDSELSRVYKVISDELCITTDESDIRYLIYCCPGHLWRKVDDAVRLRIENMLFDDFSDGLYSGSKLIQGALATWIKPDLFEQFDNHNAWTICAVRKLESGDLYSKQYIKKFFWSIICRINKNEINWYLKSYIKEGLKNGNKEIIELLKDEIVYENDHPWWEIFKEDLKDYPEIKYTDIPF